MFKSLTAYHMETKTMETKTIDADGYVLPIGRILGNVSWYEEAKEWRALVVTNEGALVVAAVTIRALDNWYDRQV